MVVDPAGQSIAKAVPFRGSTGISVISEGLPATAAKRLSVETSGRTAVIAARSNLIAENIGATGIAANTFTAVGGRQMSTTLQVAPIAENRIAAALKAVDEDLIKNEIITQDGKVHPKLEAEFNLERTTCLPTQAVVIKGCLDACNTCEESELRLIDLEVERKELENKLLARQIELLEKSQEYRCCPVGEAEESET